MKKMLVLCSVTLFAASVAYAVGILSPGYTIAIRNNTNTAASFSFYDARNNLIGDKTIDANQKGAISVGLARNLNVERCSATPVYDGKTRAASAITKTSTLNLTQKGQHQTWTFSAKPTLALYVTAGIQ